MREYEALIVIDPTVDEDALAALIERINGVITEQGGTVHHVDRWGRRRLAYEVAGHKDAFYVLITFAARPGGTAELERVLRITEPVLRFLVALWVPTRRTPPAVEAAPEAASAPATAPAAARTDGEAAPQPASPAAHTDGEAAPQPASEAARTDGEAAPQPASEAAATDGEAAPRPASEEAADAPAPSPAQATAGEPQGPGV